MYDNQLQWPVWLGSQILHGETCDQKGQTLKIQFFFLVEKTKLLIESL